MEPFRNLVFVVNAHKQGSVALAQELGAQAATLGCQVRTVLDYPVTKGSLRGADVCCVIGGDGTLLSAVKEACRENVPVIGVNMGKLGFLAMFSPEEAQHCFTSMLEGGFRISERTLIECVSASGERVMALNDVVVRSYSSRVVEMEVTSNDKLVNVYSADGLVFATPTGSTAYNLSAGGPLIHPHAPVIAMTPICPHTLSNRGVIFGDQTRLRVRLEASRKDVHVTADGQPCLIEENPFPIDLCIHPQKLKLILKPDYGYFRLVRSKLGWSGNHLRE